MVEIKRLSQMSQINKIPSMVFTFDLLTRGGIPEGKFSLFWGSKSAGKTSFALRIADSYLKLNPDKRVCFVDFEGALDKTWAQTLVEYHDNVDVAEPAYAEEGIDFLQKHIADEETGLYIIDSLASLVPVAEAESSSDKLFMGLLARTVNTMLRKILPTVISRNREGNPATVILINQVRANVGVTYGSPHKLPGGLYQEHISSLIVHFYADKVHKNSSELPYRIDYTFTIEKNKAGGIPKVAGKFGVACLSTDKYRVGEVIEDTIVMNYLKTYKIVRQDGKKYLINGEVFSTQAEIIHRYKKDHSFRTKLLRLVEEKFYGEKR